MAALALPASFRDRYGPWALVAGASEGLGAAFATGLARRGLNLLLIARRADALATTADKLKADHGVEVRTLSLDLASPDLTQHLEALARELPIGLAINNAAYAPVGAFLDKPVADLLRAVDVNVRGPLQLVRALAPAMVERGRGGIVLMSSMVGFQGSPRLATYGATKAFNTNFGEALWQELGAHHVDVVVCSAGAIRTPGYQRSAGGDAPGTLDAHVVAERALTALGHGPLVVPGALNRFASVVMGRLLPRRLAIGVMARNTRDLS